MPNQGVSPIDLTTDVGKVRLLVGDTDAATVANGQGSYLWFADTEISALLGMMGRPQRVAVHILRTVAYSTALKMRKWTSADLQVDGEAITSSLLTAAAAIEKGLVAVDAEQGGLVSITPTGGLIDRWTQAELEDSGWGYWRNRPRPAGDEDPDPYLQSDTNAYYPGVI